MRERKKESERERVCGLKPSKKNSTNSHNGYRSEVKHKIEKK